MRKTFFAIALCCATAASASNTLASVNDLASSVFNMNATAITAYETCYVSQNNVVFEEETTVNYARRKKVPKRKGPKIPLY